MPRKSVLLLLLALLTVAAGPAGAQEAPTYTMEAWVLQEPDGRTRTAAVPLSQAPELRRGDWLLTRGPAGGPKEGWMLVLYWRRPNGVLEVGRRHGKPAATRLSAEDGSLERYHTWPVEEGIPLFALVPSHHKAFETSLSLRIGDGAAGAALRESVLDLGMLQAAQAHLATLEAYWSRLKGQADSAPPASLGPVRLYLDLPAADWATLRNRVDGYLATARQALALNPEVALTPEVRSRFPILLSLYDPVERRIRIPLGAFGSVALWTGSHSVHPKPALVQAGRRPEEIRIRPVAGPVRTTGAQRDAPFLVAWMPPGTNLATRSFEAPPAPGGLTMVGGEAWLSGSSPVELQVTRTTDASRGHWLAYLPATRYEAVTPGGDYERARIEPLGSAWTVQQRDGAGWASLPPGSVTVEADPQAPGFLRLAVRDEAFWGPQGARELRLQGHWGFQPLAAQGGFWALRGDPDVRWRVATDRALAGERIALRLEPTSPTVVTAVQVAGPEGPRRAEIQAPQVPGGYDAAGGLVAVLDLRGLSGVVPIEVSHGPSHKTSVPLAVQPLPTVSQARFGSDGGLDLQGRGLQAVQSVRLTDGTLHLDFRPQESPSGEALRLQASAEVPSAWRTPGAPLRGEMTVDGAAVPLEVAPAWAPVPRVSGFRVLALAGTANSYGTPAPDLQFLPSDAVVRLRVRVDEGAAGLPVRVRGSGGEELAASRLAPGPDGLGASMTLDLPASGYVGDLHLEAGDHRIPLGASLEFPRALQVSDGLLQVAAPGELARVARLSWDPEGHQAVDFDDSWHTRETLPLPDADSSVLYLWPWNADRPVPVLVR